MKALDSIAKVWCDLEDSYAAYAATEPITRRAFLDIVLNAENGKPNITPILGRLESEVTTYTDDEIELYSVIVQSMETAVNRYASLGDAEIEDLNEFLQSESPMNILDTLQMRRIAIRSAREILDSGHFGSYSDNGSAAGLDPDDPDMRVIHDNISLFKILCDISDTSDDDCFLVKAYSALLSLNKQGVAMTNLAVLNAGLYKIADGFISAGRRNIPYRKTKVQTVNSAIFRDVNGITRTGKCKFFYAPSEVINAVTTPKKIKASARPGVVFIL